MQEPLTSHMQLAAVASADQTAPEIYIASRRHESGASSHGRVYEWSLSLTLEGRCSFQCGRRVEVVPGSLLLIRPNVAHVWQVPSSRGEENGAEAWHVLYAVFQPRPHWLRWLNAFDFVDGVTHVKLQEPALACLQRGLLGMARLYQRGGLERDAWTMLALERLLLQMHQLRVGVEKSGDLRVRAAMEFIQTRFVRPLVIAEIAAASHLSVSRLSQLFRIETGLSPIQYLEQVRLQRAEEMLRFGSASIAEIAAATGFRDPEYFASRFRRSTHMTPREFRKRQET